jgi:hypothetical protein
MKCLPLFLLFVDYEKAYDNFNRDKLWEMMDNKIPKLFTKYHKMYLQEYEG